MSADHRPAWVNHELFPFESRFVELLGHTIHYIDEGSGPPLLMLHGNPTWSFVYRHLIKGLRDRFRCVALDYPGFGLSRAAPGYGYLPAEHARVVAAFVEHLGLRGYTPVVQDWGGPIGLWVAGQRPELVRAVIILNTWAWPVDDDPHFVWFSRMMGGPIGRIAIRHANAFVNLMIPKGTPRKGVSREVMRAYRTPLDTPDKRMPSNIFPREIVKSTPFLSEVEAGLSRLADRPALIVWGDSDIAFRAKEHARFSSTFKSARSVVVPGAGHYMQEDAPDEIIEAIGPFWRDVVGG